MKREEVLTPTEREELLQEKRALEHGIVEGERERWGEGTSRSVDNAHVKRQIEHLNRAVASRTPKSLSGMEKDQIARRAREIEDRIKEGMCTKDEMLSPHKNPGAVRKHFEWEKRNKNLIREWKLAQRKLEPNDPTVSNIERLRR